MLRTVPLHSLPSGMELPADMQGKLVYDAENEVLGYRGFMSKQDFDRLARLSKDLDWQRTVEQLFQLCVYEEPTETSVALWPRLAVAGLIGVGAILAIGWLAH